VFIVCKASSATDMPIDSTLLHTRTDSHFFYAPQM